MDGLICCIALVGLNALLLVNWGWFLGCDMFEGDISSTYEALALLAVAAPSLPMRDCLLPVRTYPAWLGDISYMPLA